MNSKEKTLLKGQRTILEPGLCGNRDNSPRNAIKTDQVIFHKVLLKYTCLGMSEE